MIIESMATIVNVLLSLASKKTISSVFSFNFNEIFQEKGLEFYLNARKVPYLLDEAIN